MGKYFKNTREYQLTAHEWRLIRAALLDALGRLSESLETARLYAEVVKELDKQSDKYL